MATEFSTMGRAPQEGGPHRSAVGQPSRRRALTVTAQIGSWTGGGWPRSCSRWGCSCSCPRRGPVGRLQPLPMDPWRIGGGAASARVCQDSSFRPVEVNLVFDRSG